MASPRHSFVLAAHGRCVFSLLITLLILTAFPPQAGRARTLRVGPGEPFTVPSQAAAAVLDGDTVEIAAGAYVDCATWTRNDLVLRGVGGFAHVRDQACGRKAIWVIQGRNTTVEWIEFSGAAVPDRNGAGIRQEGADLTLRHCRFHDNENGILAGDNAASTILIEYCEFDRNGFGDGQSHNMYINHIKEFTIRYSWSHRARIGHNIKSRAFITRIVCNRISSETDGTNSREVDLPNGGDVLIIGNVLHHGPATDNSNLIGYGLEGLSNPLKRLAVASNTFVSERAGAFVQTPTAGVDTVWILNNVFVGGGAVLSGSASYTEIRNPAKMSPAAAGFVAPTTYDYHLLPSSAAVNAAWTGTPAALTPRFEYLHPCDARPRPVTDSLDAGAFECTAVLAAGGAAHHPARLSIDFTAPHPVLDHLDVGVTIQSPSPLTICLYALDGRRLLEVSRETATAGRQHVRIETAALPAGFYLLSARTSEESATRLVLHR